MGVQADYSDAVAKVRRITEAAPGRAEQLSQAVDGMLRTSLTVTDLCRIYDDVRGLHEAMEEAEKALSKLKQHLGVTVLPRRFNEEGVGNMSVKDLGARFTINTRLNASMAANKEAAMAWLRENGYEALIQETVNASTLAKFAGEYTVEQGKDLPADLFRVTTVQYVSRTKI